GTCPARGRSRPGRRARRSTPPRRGSRRRTGRRAPRARRVARRRRAAAGTGGRSGAAPAAGERSERVTDAPGDGREGLGRRRAGIGRDDRPAGVREIGQLRLQRHLTEQRDAKLVREPRAAAGAKDLRALTAVGAHEVAHIFDYPQHRDADPLEHLRAAQGIPHRHLLRRGDDDRGADVHRLGERQLRVARPRRQVHEKVVELSPPRKRARATARLAETVDCPTPRLRDEIARTVPRWGSWTGVGGGGTPPGPGRGAVWRGAVPSAPLLASATLTRTAVTPSTP